MEYLSSLTSSDTTLLTVFIQTINISYILSKISYILSSPKNMHTNNYFYYPKTQSIQ